MLKSVDCYCASLWRGGHIVKSATSLLQQAEVASMTITCNNYTDEEFAYVVSELWNDVTSGKVALHRGNNEKGSNEKLRYIGDGQAKYVCLFDDDLIYPPDYLARLIQGCDYYQGMVSMHGVILNKGFIGSYYRDRRVFPALGEVLKSIEVDIASNCGSLWKRSWFTDYQDWIDRVGEVSMDDCYVAYFMKKKGIHRYCLKHQDGYLQHKVQEESDDYVFNRYALTGNDTIQTTFINSFFRKL